MTRSLKSAKLSDRSLPIDVSFTNSYAATLHFAIALHTYLGCDDVRKAGLSRLAGRAFSDKVGGPARVATESRWWVEPRIWQTYDGAFGPMRLIDHCVEPIQRGFKQTVVWNPHEAGSIGLDDLAAGVRSRFLCVEPAQATRSLALAPLAACAGSLTLHASGP